MVGLDADQLGGVSPRAMPGMIDPKKIPFYTGESARDHEGDAVVYVTDDGELVEGHVHRRELDPHPETGRLPPNPVRWSARFPSISKTCSVEEIGRCETTGMLIQIGSGYEDLADYIGEPCPVCGATEDGCSDGDVNGGDC